MSRSSHVQSHQIVAWNLHSVIFFPFLCPSLSCFSVYLYVTNTVTGCCNFFALFNIVLCSPCWCIHTILNAGEFSSSFFSWHIVCLCHLFDTRPCALSSTFLSFGPFVGVLPWSVLRMVLSILQGNLTTCLTLWWDFSCTAWFRVFLSFWNILFLFHHLFLLVW